MMQNLKNSILDMIKGNPVIIFSKSWCPYCTEAKNIFKNANVKFEVRELD